MISTKTEYEDTALKILNIIFTGQIPTVNMIPKCTQKDFDDILEQCVKNNFIVGLEIYRSADGRLHFNRLFQPYVTFSGLSFIESIQQSKALDIANRANTNSLAAKLKANKSFILSIIALVTTLIINADKIVHNLQKVLFYLDML